MKIVEKKFLHLILIGLAGFPEIRFVKKARKMVFSAF